MGSVGSSILCRNVDTGPRQGQGPGPIVSYCASPVPHITRSSSSGAVWISQYIGFEEWVLGLVCLRQPKDRISHDCLRCETDLDWCTHGKGSYSNMSKVKLILWVKDKIPKYLFLNRYWETKARYWQTSCPYQNIPLVMQSPRDLNILNYDGCFGKIGKT